MKSMIIAGSTGMVGSIVLREALSSGQVTSVTSLVRRPSGVIHPKLREVVHQDFADLRAIMAEFENKDIAFFCIGVYTGSVPDEQFKVITVDYARSFGNALKMKSPQATLVFLSGAGADRQEKSRLSFAKYKGMAENHLLSLDQKSLYIFRPGYIYPVEKRAEPNLSYMIMRLLYPVLGRFIPHVTSEQLGKAMLKAGLDGARSSTLENKEIAAISSA